MENIVGKEFVSIYNKPFKVLFQIRSDEELIYRIKFLNSNFEKKATYLSIIKGEIFDDSELKDISLLDKRIYSSKEDGYFEILTKVFDREEDSYLVRFLDTGCRLCCSKIEILKGLIKDYNKPILYGVFYLGFLGLKNIKKEDDSYKIWIKVAKLVYQKHLCVDKLLYSYKKFKEWFSLTKEFLKNEEEEIDIEKIIENFRLL